MRILVVEDDQVLSRALLLLLRPPQFEVNVAGGIAAARETIERGGKFDLLIVNDDLREGRGSDFVRELRGLGLDPAVVMTSNSGPVALERSAFLAKPYNFEALLTAVLKTLGGGGSNEAT